MPVPESGPGTMGTLREHARLEAIENVENLPGIAVEMRVLVVLGISLPNERVRRYLMGADARQRPLRKHRTLVGAANLEDTPYLIARGTDHGLIAVVDHIEC